jgi:hypothetical protein
MPTRVPLRLLGLALSIVLTSAFGQRRAWGGKLDRVSQEARNPSSSGSSSSSSSSSSSEPSSSDEYSSSSDDSAVANGLVLVLAGITSPWWGPIYALEHDTPIRKAGFARYPYVRGRDGWLDIDYESPQYDPNTLDDPGRAPPLPQPTSKKRDFALQLGAESGYVFDRVWREGLSLRLQTAVRFEFDATWSLYMEREVGAFDNLALGREHFAWRFAQSSGIQFRTAVGVQHLIDARGDVSGFDAVYGFDAFPGRPVVMSFEGAIGNLGDAFTPRLRGTLGIIGGRFEFALGYEHQWIGKESLGGPFAMWRLWL